MTRLESIRSILSRFSLLIISLSENSAFVALLVAVPDVSPKLLIFAHLAVMISKSYFTLGKTTVPTKEIPILTPKTEAPAVSSKEEIKWP